MHPSIARGYGGRAEPASRYRPHDLGRFGQALRLVTGKGVARVQAVGKAAGVEYGLARAIGTDWVHPVHGIPEQGDAAMRLAGQGIAVAFVNGCDAAMRFRMRELSTQSQRTTVRLARVAACLESAGTWGRCCIAALECLTFEALDRFTV
jgi:hypothetical protein